MRMGGGGEYLDKFLTYIFISFQWKKRCSSLSAHKTLTVIVARCNKCNKFDNEMQCDMRL